MRSLLLVLIAAVLFAEAHDAPPVEVTGKIDFEAEEYRGVQVEFVHGRKATLDVYHGGVHQERVPLHTVPTKAELHALFQSKGFVKMTDEEIRAMKERRRKEEHLAAMRRHDEKVKRRKRAEHLREQQQRTAMGESNETDSITLGGSADDAEEEEEDEETKLRRRLDMINELQYQTQAHVKAQADLKKLSPEERAYYERVVGIEPTNTINQNVAGYYAAEASATTYSSFAAARHDEL